MVMITEVYIAPINQQFLFVPAKKDVLVQGISQGYVRGSDLEGVTLSYETAKRKLTKMAPETGSLVVDTPFLLVFQDKYRGKTLKNLGSLPIDKYVALLYDEKHVVSLEALAVELDATLESGLGVDLIRDAGKQNGVLARTAIISTKEYNPDISRKISDYNDVAHFYKRDFSHREVVDGELISMRVASLVENLSLGSGLGKNATFKQKWDYVNEKFPEHIPDKKGMREIKDEEFELNASNLETMAIMMNRLRILHGLTEDESGVLHGLNLISAAYKQTLGLGHAEELLSGKQIITPQKIKEVRRELQGVRPF